MVRSFVWLIGSVGWLICLVPWFLGSLVFVGATRVICRRHAVTGSAHVIAHQIHSVYTLSNGRRHVMYSPIRFAPFCLFLLPDGDDSGVTPREP